MTLSAAQISVAQSAAAALLTAGMAAAFLPLALAQLAFETGGFKSRVLTADNNLSGIKYVGQKGASLGISSPEGNYYAHFNSYTDWARDYIRIISRGSNPPIQAADTADLAKRLKSNGYYTDTVNNYAAGLAAWLPSVSDVSVTAQKKNSFKKSLTVALVVIIILGAFYYYKFIRK